MIKAAFSGKQSLPHGTRDLADVDGVIVAAFIVFEQTGIEEMLFLHFCFIAGFAFVLQSLWAKPMPPKVARTKGSLREGAGAVGD